MARRAKTNADYFPHLAKQGKTLFILEGKWGNDGYAFWFKLLEILTSSEHHYYDCKDVDNWEYLVQKSRLAEVSVTEMLDLLARKGNLDQELWANRIIWCQALVDNLESVYKKRHSETPSRPIHLISGSEMPAEEDFRVGNDSTQGVSDELINKEENRIEEHSIRKDAGLPVDNFPEKLGKLLDDNTLFDPFNFDGETIQEIVRYLGKQEAIDLDYVRYVLQQMHVDRSINKSFSGYFLWAIREAKYLGTWHKEHPARASPEDELPIPGFDEEPA